MWHGTGVGGLDAAIDTYLRQRWRSSLSYSHPSMPQKRPGGAELSSRNFTVF
jgi:hypothetical protein